MTLWFVVCAFWIYTGISAFYKGDWTSVGMAAFWISFSWKQIWREYDEAMEKKK